MRGKESLKSLQDRFLMVCTTHPTTTTFLSLLNISCEKVKVQINFVDIKDKYLYKNKIGGKNYGFSSKSSEIFTVNN